MGEEFLQCGRDFLDANLYEAAVERLSWSKSLFIRHDKLKIVEWQSDSNKSTDKTVNSTPSSYQQSQPSPELKEIDRLLAIAEQQVVQEPENDFDNVSVANRRVNY